MTIFERIKEFSVEEMAEFIRRMVDDDAEEDHEVACYGCMNYGTHHSDPQYKGTSLYECDGCPWENIGLDLVAWLNADVCKDNTKEE